jgi:hypothetical protein
VTVAELIEKLQTIENKDLPVRVPVHQYRAGSEWTGWYVSDTFDQEVEDVYNLETYVNVEPVRLD